MKYLLLLFISFSAYSENLYQYLEIGIGYKIQEPDNVRVNNKTSSVSFGNEDTALFEAGFEAKNYRFGIKHDSQYSTGWPFNDKKEYYKTEVFFKYKIGGRP